jgi:uncharacterized YigZ family protein
LSETLAAAHRFELEVKKSRFLARAAPVSSPAAALAEIERIADRAATHNCWAYRIGDAYRSSDDGEPSGTAGRPILAAIDGQGIDGVVVVVTRWYGGIKLGAGGLVRAYGGAAAECLRTAARVAIVVRVALDVRCSFSDTGTLRNVLAAHGGECVAEAFDEHGALLRIELPESARSAFATAVRDATRGKATIANAPAPVAS